MPAKTVLVIGSLHHDIMVEADRLPGRDETAVGHRWYPKFGGKGGNQAVAAARAGAPTRMLGAVGQDAFGAFLRAGLASGGVDTRWLHEVAGTGSGMSVAIEDARGDYAATIVSGANLCIDIAWLDDPALWQEVGLLVLQNEVPDAINLAAAQRARERGIRTVLNAAPYRPLPPALAGLVDILVVNAVEAQMMGAGAVDDLGSAGLAAERLGASFGCVVVTAGAHGLAAQMPEGGQFALPARKVEDARSHGAGDCFIGTLAAALVRGAAIRDACAEAAEAAAIHVSGRHV